MPSRVQPPSIDSHLRVLTTLALTSRVLYYILLRVSASLPLFDSSPEIFGISKWLSPLLRWDVFHFAHIAEKGYVYEHEWAFFRGAPMVMRLSSEVLKYLTPPHQGSLSTLLLGGAISASICDSTRILYKLTLHHLGSPSLAFIASVLSLLSSSPATLRFASCPEPFFTWASYHGMLCCARRQWLRASIYFAIAGAFRSNGILLGGFIIWGLLVEPVVFGEMPSLTTVFKTGALVSLIFTPFLHHHITAYRAFCGHESPASWCHNIPPSIYTHVQSTYWNVGFLRYWTLSQVPNVLLAAPPLLLILYFSKYYLTNAFIPSSGIQGAPASPFQSTSLLPHVLHAIVLTLTLIFASHTQIVLRVGPSMPLLYWAAAWLIMERPGLGKWWVGWSAVWCGVSLILWGAFLPPA